MLGNGICQSACNTPDCNFDDEDCFCSSACSPNDYGACKGDCVTPVCNFDGFERTDGCTDKFLVILNLYSNIIYASKSRVYSHNPCSQVAACELTDLQFAYENQQCVSACNRAECLWSMGYCSASKPSHCSASFDAVVGHCLKCEEGFVQYMGYCLDSCPRGFETLEELPQLCRERVQDEIQRDEIYVFENPSNAGGDGSFSSPYSTLAVGIAAVWQKRTVIYVLGESASFDNKLFNKEFLPHANKWNLLADSKYQDLEVKSLTCKETNHENCSLKPCNITWSSSFSLRIWAKTLTITNIAFTTACTLNQDCSSIYDTDLLIAGPSSVLSLIVIPTQSVTFTHIRAVTIVWITLGTVHLTDVSFVNVASDYDYGVILEDQTCPSWQYCGSLTYTRGTVSLVNNYRNYGNSVGTFLESSSLVSIEIEGVTFTSNLSYSLIIVRSFISLRIASSRFENNCSHQNLIYINPSKALPRTADKNNAALYFLHTHITLHNVQFISNFAYSRVVYIDMSRELLNIDIRGCEFADNKAYNSILYIIFQGSIPRERVDGGEVTTSNSNTGITKSVFIPRRWYNVTDSIFTRHSAFQAIFYSVTSVNNILRNVQFIGNVKNGKHYIEEAINHFFDSPGVGGNNQEEISVDSDCWYLAIFGGAENIEFDNFVQADNALPCSSAVGMTIEGGVNKLQSYFASNNTSGGNGAVLFMNVKTQLTLVNLTAVGNSAAGKGTVYLEGSADGELRLTDSVFKGNSAKGGAGIHAEIIGLLKVESTLFQDNLSNKDRGGAISLTAKLESPLFVKISECKFRGNKAAKGAAIYITSPANGDLVQVVVNTSSFSTNFAEDVGASLYLDENVNLDLQSIITHCQFTGESSPGAAVALSLNSGKLTFSHSQFAQNSGPIAAGLLIQTKDSVEILLQDVAFDSNERGPTISKPNDSINSQVSTQRCTFAKSSTVSIKMEGGTWTDVESVFSANRETGISLSGRATALLTRTSFLNNFSTINPGAVYIKSNSTLNCASCVFEGNSAGGNGGAVFAEQNAVLAMSGCRFQYNRAGQAGSALLIQSSAQAAIEDSVFFDNEAGTTGTINLQNAGLNLTAVVFDRNKATSAGGISTVQSSMIVKECEFRNQQTNFLSLSSSSTLIHRSVFENTKGRVGCMDIIQSNITVKNSIFRNITTFTAFQISGGSRVIVENCSVSGVSGENSGAVIAAYDSMSLSITESVFSEYQLGAVLAANVKSLVVADSKFDSMLRHYETNDSPFLSLSTSSALIQRSLFENSKGRITCMDILDSNVTVERSIFRNMTVTLFGVFQSDGISRILMKNCDVSEVSGVLSGAVIAAYDTVSLSIVDCVFTEYQLGAVFGDNVQTLVVSGSKFVDGIGEKGSAVCCYDCEDAKITDSLFAEQVSLSGAVYFEWTLFTKIVGNLTVSNTRWENNTSAGNAGGLMVLSYQMEMEDSVFTNNSAPTADSIAGAIYLSCGSFYICNYTIQDTSFVNNYAAKAGGAIYWQDRQPLLLDNSNEGNSAEYGPDVASFPKSINFTVAYLDESPSSRALESAINAVPGQRVKVSITASLMDHYGQLVNIDNSSTGQLVSTTTGPTLSSDRQIAVKGQFVFDDFLIYSKQDSFVNLSVSCDPWELDLVELLFYMRDCVPGESKTENSCFICPERTYSFNTSLTCQQCLSHTQCLGNFTVLPLSGYWRPEIYSELVFECPLKSACRGGGPMDDGSISYQGFCAEGYKSNMCQSCDIGFSRISPNKCGKCPRQEVNIIRIIFMAIGLFIVNAILLMTSLKSALHPKALYSIYFKIIANYWQLVFLVTEFRLKWPDPILNLFNAQQSVGGAAEQVYSIDCWLADNGDTSRVFYEKMIYIAVLPAVVIAIAVLYWIFAAAFKRKWIYLQRELLATVIIAFFIIHPTLMKSLFSLYSCAEVKKGEYWLTTDMAIKCDTTDHVFYKLAVGVPAILVWVVGFPLICLGILVKYRQRHSEVWIRLQYGFLLSGYRPSRYYWEFVLLARKLAVTCCFVFVTTSTQVKALTLQLVLIVVFYLQNEIKPFAGAGLNRLELMAITTAGLTIFSGLYYLSEDLNESGKWFFFLVIVLVNVVFIVYWGSLTLKELIRVGIKAMPAIGNRFCPSLFERDAYIEDFITSTDSKRDYSQFELTDLKNLSLRMRTKEPSGICISLTDRQDSAGYLSTK